MTWATGTTVDSTGLSPLYVNGLPVDLVADTIATSTAYAQRQQNPTNHFWSTPRRSASDKTREVIEFNLGGPRRVNRVTFDVARFPHIARVYYRESGTASWKPVVSSTGSEIQVAIGDAIPQTLTPQPPDDPGHSQHYGAGHWSTYNFEVNPITVQQMRVVMVRQVAFGPFDTSSLAVPYSLGMRNFSLGYEVSSRADVPYTNRDQTRLTEREPFATTSDMLGSPMAISIRENRASDLALGGIWRSEPQPLPNAVVSLYLDVRDAYGQPQVFDKIFVDPITSGVTMNVYTSEQDPLDGGFDGSDQPLSTAAAMSYGQPMTMSPDGMLFPDAVSYIDIDNEPIQFNPLEPWWMGVGWQPQFDSTDVTPRVIFDDGFITVGWNGTLYASYNGIAATVDPTFDTNLQVYFVVSFNGSQISIETQGLLGLAQITDRPASRADLAAAGQETTLRIGGAAQDPGSLNSGLRHFVMKAEVLTDETQAAFMANPGSFVEVADFTDATLMRNTLLRFGIETQSAGSVDSTIINPFGIIGGATLALDDVVWTPVPRDFRLAKGFATFDPTKARVVKFEFTNLQPMAYDTYKPVVKTVSTYPTPVVKPVRYSTSIGRSLNDAGGSVSGVSTAAQTLHYPDQARLYTMSRLAEPDPETLRPTTTYISSNPTVQHALRDSSYPFAAKPTPASNAPKFSQTGTHVYDRVEVLHDDRVAYQVALRALTLMRTDYTGSDNTDQYLEPFQDDQHIAGGSWSLQDGYLVAPSSGNGPFVTVSDVFASTERVTAIQFATQQTPPMQMVIDPDFDDSSLRRWRSVGSATIEPSTDFTTDISNMALVTRSPDTDFWSVIEARFPTWDAIESSSDAPGHPTWDEVRGDASTAAIGGIVSTDTFSLAPGSRVYAAARVYCVKPLTAPLFVEILGTDGRLLAQESITPGAGDVAEWYCGYTVGQGGDTTRQTWAQVEAAYPTWGATDGSLWNQIDTGTQTYDDDITVRVVQHDPTPDEWYQDNISVFSDPILWEFSNDSGMTWYPVYDIRNDPSGIFTFPDSTNPQAGYGLRWRVTSTAQDQRVDYLAIRPRYDGHPLGQPYRETIQSYGPSVAPIDQYGPIEDDPRWQAWHKPVPQTWTYAFRSTLLQHHTAVVEPIIVISNAIVNVDYGGLPEVVLRPTYTLVGAPPQVPNNTSVVNPPNTPTPKPYAPGAVRTAGNEWAQWTINVPNFLVWDGTKWITAFQPVDPAAQYGVAVWDGNGWQVVGSGTIDPLTDA